MTDHAMIDLETLSTRIDAVVVSVGIAIFNKAGILDTHHVRISWDDQVREGRSVTQKTLTWWLLQSESSPRLWRELNGSTPTPAALAGIARLLYKRRIWGNGASFDVAILRDLYESKQMRVPWQHNHEFCFRTARAGRQVTHPPTPHDPLSDAITAAQDLIEWGVLD